MPEVKNSSEKVWDKLVRSISDDQCILAIGPGLLFREVKRNDSIEEQLLLEEVREEILKVLKTHYSDRYNTGDENQNLANLLEKLHKQNYGDDQWSAIKKKYFDSDPPNELYTKIAEIPFSLIITTSPDMYLSNILDDYNYYVQYDYLKPTNKSGYRIQLEPARECPTIFSLFGTVNKTDSLVLNNYGKVASMISNFYKKKLSLPAEIKTKIENAKSCIFLGFDFDHWYTNILLDILQFNVNNKEVKNWNVNYACPSEIQVDEKVKWFYENNFKIDFINTEAYNIKMIIEELHERISKLSKIQLRTKINDPNNKFIYLLKILEKDLNQASELEDLEELIAGLEDIATEVDLDDAFKGKKIEQLETQSGRVVKLNDDNIDGTVTRDQYSAEFNKIRKNIKNICGQINKKISRSR